MLFTTHFRDRRDRKHVVAVEAATPEEALALLVAYQTSNGEDGYCQNGFYGGPPDVDNIQEIAVGPEEKVVILWHQDYD